MKKFKNQKKRSGKAQSLKKYLQFSYVFLQIWFHC